MHVVLAAHRAGVAEALGHRVDRAVDVAIGLGAARGEAAPAQLDRREHRAAPGAEVPGGNLTPGDLAQIVGHLVGWYEVPAPRRVQLLGQLLARQVAAALADARQPR